MVVPKDRIFQQIEATADLVPPQTYTNLLTHYGDLTVGTDAASGEFIPLTTVRDVKRQDGHILFAVGVIPPAVRVTERILDRSAQLSAEIELQPASSTLPKDNVSQLPDITTGCQDAATLLQDSQFWINYVLMCRRAGVEPRELGKVIDKESSWNPSAEGKDSGKVIAKGLTQLSLKTGVNVAKLTADQWANFECISGTDQLPFIENFLKGTGARGKNAVGLYKKNAGGYSGIPGATSRGYMSKAGFQALSPEQQETLTERLKEQGGTPGKMFAAYNANKHVDNPHGDSNQILDEKDLAIRVSKPLRTSIAAQIDRAEAALPANTGGGGTSSVAGDGGGSEWQQEGKSAKDAAARMQRKISDTHLSNVELGKQLYAAQAAQAAAIKSGIDNMAKTPPLKLLINPKQFSVKGEKIVQDGNWTRNGPIVEHWGDNQDTISGSGQVAGFFAQDTKNIAGPGLTRYARSYSAAWKNFQSLFLLYKNNGAMYLPEILSGGARGQKNLTLMGSIYIFYDNILYIGSFDSFTLSEEDTKPFIASYTFEFSVRAAFVLDRTNSELTYGAPLPSPQVFTQSDPNANVGSTGSNETPVAEIGGTPNPNGGVTPRETITPFGVVAGQNEEDTTPLNDTLSDVGFL